VYSLLAFPVKLEIAPAVYRSLAFLYTVRDSVYQISCASCVQLARLLAFLYTARDSVYQISCASCVQRSSRLGLSDDLIQISARIRQLCAALCLGAGPADGHQPVLCLPAVQG